MKQLSVLGGRRAPGRGSKHENRSERDSLDGSSPESIPTSYHFFPPGKMHPKLSCNARNFGPVFTIPFSFHIGLGRAIRYENFSCLHDAVFISYRLGFMPLSERFHLKTRKRYEAYRIGAFSCKQEANPIWNENGIV